MKLDYIKIREKDNQITKNQNSETGYSNAPKSSFTQLEILFDSEAIFYPKKFTLEILSQLVKVN